MGCSQILPADQSPPANCIVIDNGEDGLASSSMLVVREDGEDGDFSSPLGIFSPTTASDLGSLLCKGYLSGGGALVRGK